MLQVTGINCSGGQGTKAAKSRKGRSLPRSSAPGVEALVSPQGTGEVAPKSAVRLHCPHRLCDCTFIGEHILEAALLDPGRQPEGIQERIDFVRVPACAVQYGQGRSTLGALNPRHELDASNRTSCCRRKVAPAPHPVAHQPHGD